MGYDKMKICLIAPLPPPYGGIAHWTALLTGYAADDDEAELEVINIAPGKRATEGRTLLDRIFGQGFAMLRLRHRLLRTLRLNRPDAVHLTTSGALALVRDILFLRIVARFKVPSIYHIHFGRIPDMAERNTLEWKLLSAACRAASAVLAMDQSTEEAIKKYLPGVNIAIIPNPIDIASIPEPAAKTKVVVYVGWLVDTKGIRELLAAWGVLAPKFPEWSLRLIGPCLPSYMEFLKANYSFRQVEYCGELPHDQVLAELAGAGVFTLPSHTEGFPYSVLEAMAMGSVEASYKCLAAALIVLTESGR